MSGEQIVNRIFEAVIFDVDQTLVDSAKALAKAWGTWLAEVGVAPDPSRSFHGWTSEDIVRLCVHHGHGDGAPGRCAGAGGPSRLTRGGRDEWQPSSGLGSTHRGRAVRP